MRLVQEYLYYCPYCPFASDFKGDIGMHLEVIHARSNKDYMIRPHKHLNFPFSQFSLPHCTGRCGTCLKFPDNREGRLS
jgi:hypothetical protein